MKITPEMAISLLNRFDDFNQYLEQDVVNTYAEIMKAGKWPLCKDMIDFTGYNKNEPFNRLAAIIKYGKSINFSIDASFDDEVKCYYCSYFCGQLCRINYVRY